MSQNEEKKQKKKNASNQKRNPDGTFAKGNDFSEKYKPEYAQKLIEFFSQPLTRQEERMTAKGGTVIVTVPNEFPTMGLFARSIGVSVSALQMWAGITHDGKYRRDQFAAAYMRVKEWAEGMIESGALTGILDSNMAKFVLTNDYGKREAPLVENNVTGIDEADLEMIRRVEARLRGTDGDDNKIG